MTMSNAPAAAAPRPRTLSAQTPFVLLTGMTAWRQRVTDVPASSVIYMTAVRPIVADHNSIATVGAGFGAAKQAAPPRGVPR